MWYVGQYYDPISSGNSLEIYINYCENRGGSLILFPWLYHLFIVMAG
jgi:hypothetical protein